MQAAMILEEAHRMVEAAAEEGSPPALVFCGDLNSLPETGVMEFLLTGRVAPSHPDWITGACFRWGFASSRKAAKAMTDALSGPEPAAAWRALAESAAGERTLQDCLERCRRMGQSWGVLVEGHASAEAEDDGQVAEEEDQQVEEDEAETTSGLGAVSATEDFSAEGGQLNSHGQESQAVIDARRVLQAALRSGGTFKNNRAVAAAQLALDAGLSDLPLLTLEDSQRQRVWEHMAALQEEAEAKLQQAARAQEELSADAAVASERGAGTSASRSPSETTPGASVCGVGIGLQHPFHLTSAYEETPEFTNFVDGYVGTLDWILFDKGSLRRVASAALPSREVVAECTALPSQRFPSDHLLLAADLAWPEPSEPGGL